MLEITSLELRLIAALDDDLARIENFADAAGLKAALNRFYPNLTDDSEIVVVHFKLIRSTLWFEYEIDAKSKCARVGRIEEFGKEKDKDYRSVLFLL